jgi:hypothetical protein
MIKNKDVAEKISLLMLDVGSRIDESISMVKEQCSDIEFDMYRKAAGKVMGEMLISIMNPIYKEHPDLKPKGLVY